MPAETSPPPRATAWEWAQGALLAGNLAWTTLCLGGFRPETMVVSATLTGALLAAHLAVRAWGWSATSRRAVPAAHPAGFFFLPFLAYAAANALWVTPVPWLGRTDWLGWAQMLAVFWLALNFSAAPGPRRLLFGTAAALGVVGVALACWQRFGDPAWLMLGRAQGRYLLGRASGSFGIPNSFAAMLLLLIPPAIALALEKNAPARRTLGATALAAACWGALLLTLSRGAWLALGAALAAWPLLLPGRRWRWRLGAAGAAAGAAAAAGLVLYAVSPDIRARLDRLAADAGETSRPTLWRAEWRLFREAPVLGTGAGSFNVLFERHRPGHFQDEPLRPHNDWLNLLGDYGAVGFVLFAGAVALVTRRAWRPARRADSRNAAARGGWESPAVRPGSSPAITRALGVGLLAFALSALVDFHLKIPALAMLAALWAGELVRRAWPPGSHAKLPMPAVAPPAVSHVAPPTLSHVEPPAVSPVEPWRRASTAVCALAVASLTLLVALPHYRAEAARYGVRREIDDLATAATPDALRRVLASAPAALERATRLAPDNAQAWADLAYVRALGVRHGLEPDAGAAGRAAEAAARRALALGDLVPEFCVRLGVALDLQGRCGEAGEAFARAITLAPNSGLVWFHHAYHLSLRPAGRALARAAVATSLRLDPGNASAEALRRQLADPP